jgi:hypothetical protein
MARIFASRGKMIYVNNGSEPAPICGILQQIPAFVILFSKSVACKPLI